MKAFAVLLVSLACFSTVVLGQGFPNAVQLQSKTLGTQAFCGGFVHNRRWVISSSHCRIIAGPIKVYAGYNGTSMGTSDTPFIIRNPIAGVSVFVLGLNLASLNINFPSYLIGNVQEGQVGTVSSVYPGYMETDNVTVMGDTYCNERIPNYSSSMLCTDKCVNNPGASLQIGGKIAGIVSSGGEACQPGSPGVYTKASAFYPWITAIIDSFPF